MGTLRWIAVSASLLVLNACSTSAQTPDAKRHALRFELTGVSVTFDASRYANFDDYIAQTKAHLESYKVYFDPNNLDEELILATPFRVEPSTGQRCLRREGVSRGIVLIHGLSDMPAAMKDLANSFAKKCFLSYTLLLPAHGARASEMLDVTRHDWVAAAQFVVKSLRGEVDEVYVGGFSLGGLVALQAAINDKNIAGVFGFSPALALHRSIFLDQTIWLRYVRDWLDTDAPDDPWRFESIPFNAIAETQLLSKSVRDQLKNTPLTVPVFLAQSPDDAIVDADTNQQFFESGMTHSKRRLVS